MKSFLIAEGWSTLASSQALFRGTKYVNFFVVSLSCSLKPLCLPNWDSEDSIDYVNDAVCGGEVGLNYCGVNAASLDGNGPVGA
ncbi:hypothetical protein GEV33_001791 [Tenebrio molitor]|uniref:Uncharacterized protein n=1 Tax=Tenebrio molitor TaxID=7067 RepID=A0A8J6LGJ2_TENMO|nr:hypothetical protein GEV33_001791 [Tenebrio molitor]